LIGHILDGHDVVNHAVHEHKYEVHIVVGVMGEHILIVCAHDHMVQHVSPVTNDPVVILDLLAHQE